MNAKEMAALIDRIATIRHKDLQIDVRVTDVRMSHGKCQCQVTPLAGTGTIWLDDLTFTDISPEPRTHQYIRRD